METLILVSDVASLIFSIVGLALTIKLVLRTEKKLDKMFKLFMVALIILFFSSLVNTNKLFEVIPRESSIFISEISQAIYLLFFVSGLYVIYRAISNERSVS